jgi:hypothetical protein
MRFLSDILAKAGLIVDGAAVFNSSATGQTPATNDNSTKFATTAWVRSFVQPYTLPIASSTVLGGIKVGTGLAIDALTGVLSVSGGSVSLKSTQTFTATEGQSIFTIANGYTPGLIDVFLNGVYLSPGQTTATNGSTVTLLDPAILGDVIDVIITSPIGEGSIATTDSLPEGTVNLYYTPARVRTAISLTTTGVSGAATYNNLTGVFNIPNYQGLVPSGGIAGDILAKVDGTDYNTTWIPNFTSTVQHTVKAAVALTKGQAVYVSSADGTNMIVSKASNASEQTSSKTLGLVSQNLAINGQGFVVTEGLLAGLDTSTANAGDPVWLGTNGNLIFGLANKPVAPAHLVFIGVVTRVQSNNGEIFVKVQNGFELDELHDLSVKNASDGDMIKYVASTGLWTKIAASTTNIVEGTNLYYTAARVAAYLTANSYATQGYVNTAISNLVASAPTTLDTLNELATALGNDPNFATTIATSIGTKVPQTRTITINGTAYDLSADRSWSIAAGVTSFNTRTGAITLTSGDVTGALGYTPYNSTNPSGYITSYTETDTLATVVARGSSTGGGRPITLDNSGGGIFIKAGSGGWSMGTYFRGNGDTILAGFGALGANNSLTWAWIGAGYESPWVTLNGSVVNSLVALQQNGNQVLHAGNYSSYALPLSGGVVTGLTALTGKVTLGNRTSAAFNGNIAGLTINNTVEIRSTGSENPPGLTWHYEGLATRHILMTSAGVINVVSPSTENGGVAILAVNGNTVWHAGNLTNLNQLTNGPGYITSSSNVAGLNTTFLDTGSTNISSGFSRVIRNENANGGNMSYAPVLHLAASDTMWQIQGDYSSSSTLKWRAGYSGTWYPWRDIFHSGFSAYSYASSLNQNLTTGSDVTHAILRASSYVVTPLIYSGGGSVNFGNNVSITPSSASWAEGLAFSMATTSTWGGLRWRRERSNADGNWYVGFTALDSSDDLVFGANNGGTQNDSIIRLTKAGLVSMQKAPSGVNLMLGSIDYSRAYPDSDRHGLVINAPYYPHLDINSLNNASNDTHGPVISMTGILTAGGYRRWGMGIANTNPSHFSIGWADNNNNPHYGVGHNWSQGGRFIIDTSGNIWCTGDVTAYGAQSDVRLKTIKEKVPNALDGVCKLNGYRFDWKEREVKITTFIEDIGVIAQEVKEVFPELARTGEDGWMSVRYQGLTAVLIEAVKEQQAQITEQKAQIDELVAIVKTMKGF